MPTVPINRAIPTLGVDIVAVPFAPSDHVDSIPPDVPVKFGEKLNTALPPPALPTSSVNAAARLALDGVASQVAMPVPRPVIPPTAIALAVIDVLQPKPVLVVQIRALEDVLHVPIESAVGEAVPEVAFPTMVFVVWVAKVVSGITPAPPTVPVKVGDASGA